MQKPKRLFFDIEVGFDIGFFWSAGYKQTIDYTNIIKEREIICICYKWEGERKVYSLQWDKSDKKMLQEFIPVLNQADEIIGHNGDRFDLAWIRTRCLFHRLPMFPTYRSIDTLKVARSKFRFNSNRLDYIGKFLGYDGKHSTSIQLWKDIVLDNSPSAMRKMIAYCKQDVKLLENVFNELSKHLEPKVHHGVLMGEDRGSCPHCGSLQLHKKRYRTTATGMIRVDYGCHSCGKYHSKSEKGVVCQR